MRNVVFLVICFFKLLLQEIPGAGSRFQIEFLYRDAKQYCGLTNCQARSENKLNFHFNAALTAVNLAKMEWLDTRISTDEPFSMSNIKSMYNNELLLKTFKEALLIQ